MAYEKQNFLDGQIITADHLNHIEDGIVAAQNPRNLLDNSDFTNPVNQRGATEYNGNSYGIDRWCGTAQYQTVSIQNNYITISATGLAYCGIRQKLENMGKLSGKTITFAVQIYSSVGTYIAFMDESGNSIIHVDGVAGQKQILVLTYTIPSNATSDNVIPTIVCRTEAKGDSANIYWAAFYEGSYTADTLPPYVPKGYAAELAECMRYYLKLYNNKTMLYGNSGSSSGTGARLFLPTPVPMRINPTVSTITVGVFTQSGAINNVTYTPTSATASPEGIAFYGDFSSVISASPGYVAAIANIQNDAIELSADL